MRTRHLVVVFAFLAASGCSDGATSTTTTVSTPTSAPTITLTPAPDNSEAREREQRVYLAILDVQDRSADEQQFWLDYGYGTCDMLSMGMEGTLIESSMEPMTEALTAAEAQGDLAPLADGARAVIRNGERITAVASPGSLCPEYQAEVSTVIGAMGELLELVSGNLKEGLEGLGD